jgi:beta-glucanase (GH16 family)
MRNVLCIALAFVGIACGNATKSGAPAAGKDGGTDSNLAAGSSGTTGSGGTAGQIGPGGTSGAGGMAGVSGMAGAGGGAGTGGVGAPQDAAAGGVGGITSAGSTASSGGTTTTAGSGGTGGTAGGASSGSAASSGGTGGGSGIGTGELDAGGASRDAGRDAGSDAASAPDSATDVIRDATREQASVTADAGSDAIPVPDGYVLAWSDEFDVDGAPNPKNWNFETGFVRNQELQWYQAANASVAGGLLVIEARREQVANPNYSATGADWKTQRQYAQYTSSSMTTSGLHTFLYGRFEMRARIDTDKGMWPAFWTVGSTGEWPGGGEIDIMEYYNGNILANVAWGTSTRWVAQWDSVAKAVTSFGDPQWSSKFHVWRMDWDAQNIVLSVDDYQMNTTSLATAVNPDGTSPFKKNQYIIVNLAIGGQNGGDPSATTFPARYQIDYVRVFQKQ